jgi:tRNA threonylcarbamoyl adenosine modification protein YeaZ
VSRLLAISTSREWLGLCLWETRTPGQAGIKARFFRRATHKHSDWIIPRIDSLLKRVRWAPKSLNGIAIDVGPGSFTGVRIGLTVARTLSQGLEIPLIGVPSLDIAAAGAQGLSENDRLACTAPAVPGEVYLGIYRARRADASLPRDDKRPFQKRRWFPGQGGWILERLGPLAWMSLKESARRIESARTLGTKTITLDAATPRPEVLAGLAQWAWDHHGRASYHKVVPLYLQPSWAERKKVG